MRILATGGAGRLWIAILVLLGSLAIATAVMIRFSWTSDDPPISQPRASTTVAPTTAPTTAPTAPTASASRPAGNPARVCDTAELNAGPTTPPTGAVAVMAGDNSAVDF